jgi:hypothetical protein
MYCFGVLGVKVIMKKRHKWNRDEELILKENWHKSDRKKLEILLPKIPYYSIKNKAKKMKLKRIRKHFPNLSYLLEENLESLYWVGFCLADGYFNSNRNLLKITLAEKDEKHLKILASKLNTKTHKKDVVYKDYGYSTIRVGDQENLPKIIKKFNIKNIKTYNPPEVSYYKKISKDKLTAIFLGIIDGDGCIKQYSKNGFFFRIECNESWENFLNFISDSVITCNENPKRQSKNKNKKTFIMQYNGNKALKFLKRFAKTNNIPILERKWNIIEY